MGLNTGRRELATSESICSKYSPPKSSLQRAVEQRSVGGLRLRLARPSPDLGSELLVKAGGHTGETRGGAEVVLTARGLQ